MTASAPARLESIARHHATRTPLLVFPGQPCPEPRCRGHLRSYGSTRTCCDQCFWGPEDGISLSAPALDAWMRRCATDSIPARDAVARRSEPDLGPEAA